MSKNATRHAAAAHRVVVGLGRVAVPTGAVAQAGELVGARLAFQPLADDERGDREVRAIAAEQQTEPDDRRRVEPIQRLARGRSSMQGHAQRGESEQDRDHRQQRHRPHHQRHQCDGQQLEQARARWQRGIDARRRNGHEHADQHGRQQGQQQPRSPGVEQANRQRAAGDGQRDQHHHPPRIADAGSNARGFEHAGEAEDESAAQQDSADDGAGGFHLRGHQLLPFFRGQAADRLAGQEIQQARPSGTGRVRGRSMLQRRRGLGHRDLAETARAANSPTLPQRT